MTFVERLLLLMKNNNITAYKLSKNVGISESLISKWQKNPASDPSARILLKLCEFFHVSMEWLLTGEGEMYRNADNINQSDMRLLNDFNMLDDKEKALVMERIQAFLELKKPLGIGTTASAAKPARRVSVRLPEARTVEVRVYDERASAGLGNYLCGDSTYDTISVSADSLPEKADFGVHICGNSMEPDIPDKSIVWVKSQPEIDSGQIGIFTRNGEEAFCKRLRIDYEKREIHLVSVNPEYAPIKIASGDFLRTIGLVVGEPYIF